MDDEDDSILSDDGMDLIGEEIRLPTDKELDAMDNVLENDTDEGPASIFFAHNDNNYDAIGSRNEKAIEWLHRKAYS